MTMTRLITVLLTPVLALETSRTLHRGQAA
jgi:hypothetical protein